MVVWVESVGDQIFSLHDAAFSLINVHATLHAAHSRIKSEAFSQVLLPALLWVAGYIPLAQGDGKELL